MELQCDSTLTNVYQVSIRYLLLESAFLLPSIFSQQAEQNSSSHQNVFTDSPFHCPRRFVAVTWLARCLSLLCSRRAQIRTVIPQTNFLLISGRGLVWSKNRMWDLDLRKLATSALLMKSLKADGLMSWKWCLNGTYWMGLQSWFITVPVQLLWMADVFWGFWTQKGHAPPLHTRTKIQKFDGKFYFKFTSPSSRNFCFRRGIIRILSHMALFNDYVQLCETFLVGKQSVLSCLQVTLALLQELQR